MSKDYERLCATSLGDSVKEELRGSLPSGTVGGTLQSPNVREVDPTAKHFYRSLVLQVAEGTGYGHLFAPIMVPRGSWV